MGIRQRLIRIIGMIFMLTFGSLLALLFGMPLNVRVEIDQELQLLAQEMLADTEFLESVELSELDWPSAKKSSFQIASSFYVVINQDGEVVGRSENLPRNAGPLLPNFEQYSPAFENIDVGGDQTLRVLHFPLIGEYDNNRRVITGYLQVGRLINDYVSYRRLTTVSLLMGGAALSMTIAALGLGLPFLFAPLTNIIEVADQITSADDLSRRIPETDDTDEIGQLTGVLNQLIGRIEGLFKLQQRLLQDVSHELRTPLTGIRGNVDLIRRIGTADPESLDAIEAEATRMTRLVNDLLSLARAEVGGLPIRRDVVDLDNIFLNVFEQVSISNSGVRVILQEVEPIKVVGDTDRLRQLLLNLMTNAVKYSDQGERVVVSLKRVGKMAEVIIADNGIGIPAEDLPYIFDRFYRVSKARTRERGGSGLGLAIAQSIARAHRGFITVDSQIGEGSTFTVTIPTYDQPQANNKGTENRALANGSTSI